MCRTSEKSYRVIQRTSTRAFRIASTFATEINLGLNEIGRYNNRFGKRRSRQFLEKEKEVSITAPMYFYNFRQKLQIIEFLTIWALVFALIASSATGSQCICIQVYTISRIRSVFYLQPNLYMRNGLSQFRCQANNPRQQEMECKPSLAHPATRFTPWCSYCDCI